MSGLPGINSTHPNVIMYTWVVPIVIEKIKAILSERTAARQATNIDEW